MARIKSNNIQYGDNYVLPIELSEEDRLDYPEKLKSKKSELKLLQDEIDKTKQEQQKIIEEATLEAKNIINQAQTELKNAQKQIEETTVEQQKQLAEEAEKVKAEAYQTGYDDGYKQGYTVITNELENKVYSIDKFASSQFDLKTNIIKSAELDILNLVIEIAQKVCTKSIEINPELIGLIIKNAINELKDKEEITIIVNPKLREILDSISSGLKEDIPQLKSIKIVEDKSVSPDGAIVETLLTRVDSRVKSQINEISDKLMNGYNIEDDESMVLSYGDNSVEEFENITLSDDANIDAFLKELESIPSFDDKAREEDANYYKNLDIDELRNDDIPALENENKLNIGDINIDEYEEENLMKETISEIQEQPTQIEITELKNSEEISAEKEVKENLQNSNNENINVEEFKESNIDEIEVIQNQDDEFQIKSEVENTYIKDDENFYNEEKQQNLSKNAEEKFNITEEVENVEEESLFTIDDIKIDGGEDVQ